MTTNCPFCQRSGLSDVEARPREGFEVLDRVYQRNRELESRIQDRTRELELANIELRAEIERRRSAEAEARRLSTVFSDAAVPIVLAGLDGMITDANPETERVYGWSRAELIGQPLQMFVPVARRRSVEWLIELCRNGEGGRNVPGILVGKDGVEREVLTTHSLLRDEAGVGIGIASISKDVSELKGAQRLLSEVNDELKSLALRDGLTDLGNRRNFDQVYERELRRAVRSHLPLSVAMIDIDFFAAYNDSLGHPAGDECLRVVARAIRTGLRRPGDFVARYGGEEFCVVLPDTDLQGAVWLAERLRTRVELRRVAHPGSSVSDRVTVSIGVACARVTQSLSSGALLEAADKALYLAKQGGRNRVHIAHLPERGAGAGTELEMGAGES